jgi:hypothetical protein
MRGGKGEGRREENSRGVDDRPGSGVLEVSGGGGF